jgi:hypothetical protein
VLPIDQNSLSEIRPELAPGERVFWAGRPNTRTALRDGGPIQMPYPKAWGAFTIVWEWVVIWSWVSKKSLGAIFVIPFGIMLIGMAEDLVWGRFRRALRTKKATYYAVTDRRVMVIQNWRQRKVASSEISSLPALIVEKKSGDMGTLRFFQCRSRRRGSGRKGGTGSTAGSMYGSRYH